MRVGANLNLRGLESKARELESYCEEKQELSESQLRYEQIEGNLEKQISLGIGFAGLIGSLKGWGEGRWVIRDSRESRKEEVNMDLPNILGGFCE